MTKIRDLSKNLIAIRLNLRFNVASKSLYNFCNNCNFFIMSVCVAKFLFHKIEQSRY